MMPPGTEQRDFFDYQQFVQREWVIDRDSLNDEPFEREYVLTYWYSTEPCVDHLGVEYDLSWRVVIWTYNYEPVTMPANWHVV